jgi:hypothetical protein
MMTQKRNRAYPFLDQGTRRSVGAILAVLFGGNFSLASQAADVSLNQLIQEYDGEAKFPLVSTNPPNLETEIKIFPRSQSEVVFQTTPALPLPSYQSYGLERSTVDRGLGDVVNLGGSNRRLESVDVTMVNFAKAVSWPDLAAADPAGYRHPLTIIVYEVSGESLVLLTQQTQEVLIPWRSETLDDGGENPFEGAAFTTRFDFSDELLLTEQLAVLVAYNTESSGFDPIGSPGPYNGLNLALSGDAPSVGTDDDPTRMLRLVAGGFFRSRAFGSLAPIFTVRTFSANPSQGVPRDGGGYLVKARVTEEGFTGEATANFAVTPLSAEVSFANKKQAADGTPKALLAVTDPADLPYEVVYAQRSGPPTARGHYPVFITLTSPNYRGSVSGLMSLGYSYQSWIAEKVAGGSIPSAQAGQSDDPDFDDRTNLQEYLVAGDPANPNDAAQSLTDLVQAEEGGLLTFFRNNEAGDVGYQVQFTNTLADPGQWLTLAIPASATSPPPPSESIAMPVAITPGIKARFFRVKYEILAPGG